ncbi:hypothetical protein [Lacibacter sp.]|uniref:HORMA-1 domain-containing protein n=1 Tax=Lacibacter sp. TaxID=1915409 RepID=UPI002B4B1819|nr:hypothetical protein [Lacibacter sp.]HLP37592.1 hypothetical protein [Lacibacter sp.]
MSTYTFTGTDSYSVSDVKAVMQNTYEDIIGFANRQIVEYGNAEKWIDDLTYALNKKAVKSFEIQLYNSLGVRFKSYRYDVCTSGLVTSGDKSGGINYFDFPTTTKVGLFAQLDKDSSNYAAVLKELTENRGWGTNGSAMNGTTTRERNYVSNSLQLSRSVITK